MNIRVFWVWLCEYFGIFFFYRNVVPPYSEDKNPYEMSRVTRPKTQLLVSEDSILLCKQFRIRRLVDFVN